MKRYLLLILAAVLLALPAHAQANQHTISVKLNYDFTVDNACSSTVTTACLKQFNVYDLTTGTPVKLFTFPAPSGANTALTGIAFTSAALTLKSGVHIFGATAQMADGTESLPNASTATATVAPTSPVSFSLTVQ